MAVVIEHELSRRRRHNLLHWLVREDWHVSRRLHDSSLRSGRGTTLSSRRRVVVWDDPLYDPFNEVCDAYSLAL
jgi:hypothetical protein